MRRRTIAAVLLGVFMGSCIEPAYAARNDVGAIVRALDKIAKALERNCR